MEPVFYVMAILGCGDFQDQCQQARVEPVRYQSAAQCQAAMAQVPETALADFANAVTDPLQRIRHAHGESFPDWLAHRFAERHLRARWPP